MREEFSIEEFVEEREEPVPFRALVLSVFALVVPVMGVSLAPDFLDGEQGLLLWLVALIPPFLLTYYRGWRGASIGLAAGMAAITAANLVLLLTRVSLPDFTLLLWIVATYIVVCVGAGVLVEVMRRERRSAEEMALTDALTGLPNRRHANIFLDAAFAAASRGPATTVVLFRIDEFSQISSGFGYAASDSVLRRLGAVLTDITRRMDLSARWGEQEFITVLARSNAAGARIFAERVQKAIQDEVFPWGSVTLSAGIAEYETGMGSPELLIAAADRSLYAAQDEGRSRVRVARSAADASENTPDPRGVGRTSRPLAPIEPPEVYHAHQRGIRLRSGAEAPLFLPSSPGRKGGDQPSRNLPDGKERILVIDDNEQARRGVARILSHLGYQVQEAADADSALALLREDGRFDLLVVDLIMPGMSGFTLVELIQKDFGPRRILYMSGFVQGDFSWDGAPGAIVSFLGKPMTANVLANQVRALLDLTLTGEGSPGTVKGSLL